MDNLLDRSAPVRSDEQLDVARLEPYLRERLPDAQGALVVEQFPSGHSNLTYLLRFEGREYVLRRPPFGSKVVAAHDMGREFKVLSKLHAVYPPAPRPFLYCEDESVLGVKFYVMERVRGIILRHTAPPGFAWNPGMVHRCCESFVENLAQLHALDYQAIGLAELAKPGQYMERQVRGWSQRYYGSKTDDIPDIETMIRWLQERIPPDSGAVLIHNDYKFDNIVLDPSDPARIIGVLDWEMATIGDPLSDLACALSYWIEPGDAPEFKPVTCFLTTLPGSMTRSDVAERYGARTGRDTSNLLCYYIFALLKLAVIIQQIYYRYAKGFTKDPRFATMIDMVRTLGKRASATIEAGTM
ncbi:MAG: phosphotransferase family protein [Candidatus Hydrogenedentes bacterium]|nr:phosphotransferase family protein [Candidatus Hydrogenedentota bacterium]